MDDKIPCPHLDRPRPTQDMCDVCFGAFVSDLSDTGRGDRAFLLLKDREERENGDQER